MKRNDKYDGKKAKTVVESLRRNSYIDRLIEIENLDDAVKDIKRTTEEFASFYKRLELKEQIQSEIMRKLHVYFKAQQMKECNLIDCFDDMSSDLCQIVEDNFNKYELESHNAEEELK